MTFSRLSVAAVLCALGSAVACGRSSSEPGSGETHFLITCQQSCGGGLECLCGVCSRACDDDIACTGLGQRVTCVQHDAGSCSTVTKSCDVTCSSDPDCGVVSTAHVCSAGLCRTERAGGGSGGSGSGGSAPASSGSSGAGGLAGAGGMVLQPGSGICESCANGERWSCGIKGSCSKEAACEAAGCGGPIVADDGCVRPECAADADCAADERCATAPVTRFASTTGGCFPLADACSCPLAAVGGTMKICSPTALSGQRGAWSSIVVKAVGNLSSRSWILREDGSVTAENTPANEPRQQYEAVLSAMDLATLDQLLQGADVRRVLASDEPCTPAFDYTVEMQLELYDETGEGYQPLIVNDVTGCVLNDMSGSPLTQVLDIAERY